MSRLGEDWSADLKNPLYFANNQQNIVVNFHQDFMSSTDIDYFLVETDSGLFYWHNHFGEIVCPTKMKT